MATQAGEIPKVEDDIDDSVVTFIDKLYKLFPNEELFERLECVRAIATAGRRTLTV